MHIFIATPEKSEWQRVWIVRSQSAPGMLVCFNRAQVGSDNSMQQSARKQATFPYLFHLILLFSPLPNGYIRGEFWLMRRAQSQRSWFRREICRTPPSTNFSWWTERFGSLKAIVVGSSDIFSIAPIRIVNNLALFETSSFCQSILHVPCGVSKSPPPFYFFTEFFLVE